jgi:phage-related protein
MTDTFPFKTETTGTGETNVAVYETKFGDGYSQSVVQGLNAVSQVRTVVHSGYAADVQLVVDWLKEHRGVSFFWTPPFASEPGYFRCKAWRDRNNGGNHYTLEMDFYEVFGP